ncbi:MAG: nucleotidyltransferase domain-containing protein, partial [Burkholderiales bacterium]
MLRTDSSDQGDGEPGLANLLFGTYRHRVLSLLLLRPGESFHVRRIARLTGVPAGSLHRELKLLAEAGLLRREPLGNQIRYSANANSSVFEELSGILDKTAGAPPTLESPAAEYSVDLPRSDLEVPRRALAALCRRYGVKKMSVFGSAARGELRPDSDVDLLVEFKPASKTTLWGLVDMEKKLSELFGKRKVDIAGPDIMKNPSRRRAILPELKV